MIDKRLIEVTFPLRQASIDSVHEKNVPNGRLEETEAWETDVTRTGFAAADRIE